MTATLLAQLCVTATQAAPDTAASAAPTATFEPEPELDAAELVQPSLLSGPGYTVAPKAQVLGYQARFVVRTGYGEIPAESVEMLAVRVAEMPAVEAIHDASVSRVLAQSAVDTAKDGGSALWQVVRHPVATAKGLPQGVARYFGRKWRQLAERASKLGDKAWQRIGQEGNPYRNADGPMTATRVGDAPRKSWYDKPRKELGSLARGELSFGRARRAWARTLGIDPGTSNPLIAPRLDALAWSAVGGGQIGGLALGQLGGTVTGALGDAGRVNDAVWQLDPVDLRARNRGRISMWCTDETLLRRFLRHGPFGGARQTALVEQMRDLQPASGCNALLETALMAGTEQEARFVVNAIALLNQHLGDAAHGGDLVPIGATLAFRAPDGELLLPLPVDHLAWTKEIQDFFDADGVRGAKRTALVTGAISLRAQHELTERGFSLVPHLPYPGAPGYAPSPADPARVAQATP
ncbi:hypothetical protein [Chiayiivirga flava]|uniref:Uncharacterized protein n=1 Tax=Chiayiivirga flava TaxID=659595 RepID=A0A7W8G047_9GAMM|nr:hypothetical protein [Chiayiivirga flava]MBB5207338.1 hypothetical protein [Chiayiivirga flava]